MVIESTKILKMKRLFTILILFCAAVAAEAQITEINKPLKDFSNVYDLSTPLSAGITILYANVNGNENIWRDASVFSNSCSHQKNTLPNRFVDEDTKERLLNIIIEELIVYNDSIACVITKNNSERFSIRLLGFEDGNWLNICENGSNSLESLREWFYTYASYHLNRLRMSSVVKKVSTDTLAFVNCIKQQGVAPKEYLLEVLAKHPLVIFGEIHRRKISWDLLSSVLFDPRFSEIVGTIFVELPAYQQDEFNRFYSSKELDTEILLDIMRSMMTTGWIDRGEYEFLINLWKLNQTLSNDMKIRVVPVDEQTPWKFLQTKDDYDKWEANSIDRNTRMADVVEQTIKTKNDTRNNLFIVGYGHAYKSHIQGSYSTPMGQDPALTAGAQLVQRFSNEDVFTILQHVPMGTNFGALGLVRQGLFDVVFEKIGNLPIAFNLANTPFGSEPFDADFEDAFDSRVGNYADNFDGYIFLQPLKDEDTDYVLYDIISDKYISEIKRRETLTGRKLYRWIEGELTKEKIIESWKEDEGKKRWRYLFEEK